jgi:hypothetical protein
VVHLAPTQEKGSAEEKGTRRGKERREERNVERKERREKGTQRERNAERKERREKGICVICAICG